MLIGTDHGGRMSSWPKTLVKPPGNSKESTKPLAEKDYGKLLLGLNPNNLRWGLGDKTSPEKENPVTEGKRGERRIQKSLVTGLIPEPLPWATIKRNLLSFCNRQAFGWLQFRPLPWELQRPLLWALLGRLRGLRTMLLGHILPRHGQTHPSGEAPGWRSPESGTQSCPWWRPRTGWASEGQGEEQGLGDT